MLKLAAIPTQAFPVGISTKKTIYDDESKGFLTKFGIDARTMR
jgi:hypothetical protein